MIPLSLEDIDELTRSVPALGPHRSRSPRANRTPRVALLEAIHTPSRMQSTPKTTRPHCPSQCALSRRHQSGSEGRTPGGDHVIAPAIGAPPRPRQRSRSGETCGRVGSGAREFNPDGRFGMATRHWQRKSLANIWSTPKVSGSWSMSKPTSRLQPSQRPPEETPPSTLAV